MRQMHVHKKHKVYTYKFEQEGLDLNWSLMCFWFKLWLLMIQYRLSTFSGIMSW